MKYYVYELIDPRDHSVFYVGKGTGNRMYCHVDDVNKGIVPHNNKHLFYKIKQILAEKLEVKYNKTFFTNNEKDAYNAERKLQDFYDMKNLCNIAYRNDNYTFNPRKNEISRTLSEACSGELNGMFGKKHTNKSIELMKKNRIGLGGQKGSNNPMYGACGDKNPRSLLSNNDRAEIIHLCNRYPEEFPYHAGRGVRSGRLTLSKIYGVSNDVIDRIVRFWDTEQEQYDFTLNRAKMYRTLYSENKHKRL